VALAWWKADEKIIDAERLAQLLAKELSERSMHGVCSANDLTDEPSPIG
jgi:hypothetical protein